MKSTIIVKGPVTITYLRNGGVRIEAEKKRARMHIRGDEFMALINAAARTAGVGTAPLVAADAPSGIL
jgi:hypothetical protein